MSANTSSSIKHSETHLHISKSRPHRCWLATTHSLNLLNFLAWIKKVQAALHCRNSQDRAEIKRDNVQDRFLVKGTESDSPERKSKGRYSVSSLVRPCARVLGVPFLTVTTSRSRNSYCKYRRISQNCTGYRLTVAFPLIEMAASSHPTLLSPMFRTVNLLQYRKIHFCSQIALARYAWKIRQLM